MTDLSHIDPRLHHLFDKPVEDRVSYLIAEKFIPYPLAEYVIEEIRGVMMQNESARYKCTLVCAEPGRGKTMILNECVRLFEGLGVSDSSNDPCRFQPLVFVTLPHMGDLRAMYSRILRVLGIPHSINDKPALLNEQVCQGLLDARTRLLVV